MHAAPPRRRRSAARQREPLEPEVAYRGLVAATILRALRDLRLPAWRYDAQWWLAGEGREWGELIDVDVSKLDRECRDTKGQE
jgi:hypothetical protein